MSIDKIMVVGAGQMGSGIAQVCAMSGIEVVLHDISEEIVEKGINSIDKQLTRLVEKGKMSENEKNETQQRRRDEFL